MKTEEIKVRQMTNQYLLDKGEKLTVVRDLCGIQAQFMVNAMHSLKIRCRDFREETVAKGLVKNWTVRGTVHVFAESDLPLFKHCNNGRDYRRDDWGGYTTWQRPDGSYIWYNDGDCRRVWALTPERQRYFSNLIVQAVSTAPQTRDELKELCRGAGMTDIEAESMFNAWGGGIRDLCERGFMNYVVQEKKAYTASPSFEPIPEDEANLELARRYFTNMGPATIHDAMYYFGVNRTQVKAWLSRLPVTSVTCEDNTYYYIENGKQYKMDIPSVLFLAGFDQLMLAYQKKESLYLPEAHLRGIFNLAGIVMPPILLHGRVVGKWKKKNAKLVLMSFETLSADERKTIESSAEALWTDLKSLMWE